jgi:hypothetical protein
LYGYNPHPAICEMCKFPSRQRTLTKTKEDRSGFQDVRHEIPLGCVSDESSPSTCITI